MSFTLIQIAAGIAFVYLLYVSTQVWQERSRREDLYLPVGILLMVLPSALGVEDWLMAGLLLLGLVFVGMSRWHRESAKGKQAKAGV